MSRTTRVTPRLVAAATVTAIVALAQIARADDRAELLRSAGEDLGRYYKYVRELTARPTHPDELPTADQCDAAVKAWKAKGVKDGDRIFSYDFNQHPTAKDNTIPLSEMPAVCASYRPLYASYKIHHDLKQYDGVLMRIRDKLIEPGDSSLSAHLIAEYERTGDPAGCKATVAAAKALDPTMLYDGTSGALTLPEYDTKVCDELAVLHPPWVAQAKAALRANREKAMAPFVKAGIGGKKLDLMIEYDGVYWRLPGGARSDDPVKLARASTLFHWLEAADRDDPRYVIHTIRKYRFKGNDLLGVSEKQYRKKQGVELGAKAFK